MNRGCMFFVDFIDTKLKQQQYKVNLIEWSQKIKEERKEVYNVRNVKNLEIFTKNTSNNSSLLKALQNQEVSKGGSNGSGRFSM